MISYLLKQFVSGLTYSIRLHQPLTTDCCHVHYTRSLIFRSTKKINIQTPGIFLNLAAFGLTKGCYQNDCSHSDHFETDSAAFCAEVCRIIGACKYWSVTVGGGESTCWLRGPIVGAVVNTNNLGKIDRPGALSAVAECHPPMEDHRVTKDRGGSNDSKGMSNSNSAGHPTLFDRLRGKPLRHPKIAEVLSMFGHMTQYEIANAPPSALQKVAVELR